MTSMVSETATALASRTSRRSFIGRTSKLVLGVLAGSATAGIFAQTASAACDDNQCQSFCPEPCVYQTSCECVGDKIARWWQCPTCEFQACTWGPCCTNITCG